MPTFLKRTLSTLAILLVACAQVFGLQRGYECHHQDIAIVTAAEHCHHLSTGFVPCATAHDHASPAHSDDDHDDGEEAPAQDPSPERHLPLTVSTTAATSSQTSATAPAFIALPLVQLPAFTPISSVHSATAAHPLKIPLHLSSAQRPPPASLQVARSIVLLV